MFVSHINKEKNEAVVNYNGKDKVSCDIIGMRFIKGMLYKC